MELLESEMSDISDDVKKRVKSLIRELEEKATEKYGSGSLKNLNKLTGVSHEAFRDYRDGKPPSGQTLRKLAPALGKDAMALQVYIETGVYLYQGGDQVSEESVVSYMTDLEDSDFSKVMSEIYRKRSG